MVLTLPEDTSVPLYEYRCTACGHVFEKIQSFNAPETMACPFCEGASERLLSAPAIQFKGSGFYLTDYGKSGAGASKGEGAANKSGADASSAGAKSGDSGSGASSGGAGASGGSGGSGAGSGAPSNASASSSSGGAGSGSGTAPSKSS